MEDQRELTLTEEAVKLNEKKLKDWKVSELASLLLRKEAAIKKFDSDIKFVEESTQLPSWMTDCVSGSCGVKISNSY